MIAARLLDRLEGVRQTAPDRWVAKCPAHDDRHPSLSVREIDNDRVLVKCFTGCDVAAVLSAVGLEIDALYPERPTHRGRSERRPFPATDVLRAIEREALIVAMAASRLGNGGTLTDEDRGRLLIASGRITAAVQESRHV